MPVLLIDIDGLRPDVFCAALEAGRLPGFARLLGGAGMERGLLIPALAPAPSITFASQACLFTGEHPAQHGIPGNEFFDRFGLSSEGKPRHYAFDVGDTLAADDAVLVFTSGLASRCLQVPTLYERYPGLRSAVFGHMYARGAGKWEPPSLISLARFTKGGNLFGMSAEEFDRRTLKNALDSLSEDGLPDLTTVYFMGVDHESHRHGPQAQAGYLVDVLDGYVGELGEAVFSRLAGGQFVTAIFSDHGQIGVPEDDTHSLRLAFPFENEMGPLFDALGLDVHDFPGEDPNTDAVVGSNGGMAHVYLRNRSGAWSEAPRFESEVLPVGKAFWEAHATGRYAAELKGALAGVLARNVERDGWRASYQALTPAGDLVSLDEWFGAQPEGRYIDPANRVRNMAGPLAGDLLLISNYDGGYYFAAPVSGVHGGLHPEDSRATLVFGLPQAGAEAWKQASDAVRAAIQARCQAEGGRQPSTADMLTGLQALLERSFS